MAKISLDEAEKFEFACKEYAQRIEEMITFLKNSVTKVGYKWNDSDYQTVYEMVVDIEHEAAAALIVANEEIIPYVSKVVEMLKNK
ncbi:MAG: hypothetical protein J6X49_17985 [Victivallales bacterium]|nr:hypothetical protein [Victivallales bacterium]